ncbi:MAG: hypothetical protein ACFFEA_07745 [Candidatus Thorarchaeota archaeon]
MKANWKRVNTMLFTFTFLFMFTTSMQFAAAINDNDNGSPQQTTLYEYMMQYFDGKGFAEYPGQESTLQSTLDGLHLIQAYVEHAAHNNPALDTDHMLQFDTVYGEIALHVSYLQTYNGGFSPELDDDTSDIHTTADCLEILSLMNRTDAIDVGGVEWYLQTFFRGGLDVISWTWDGEIDVKTAGLRAASAISSPSLIGVHSLTLDDVVLDPGPFKPSAFGMPALDHVLFTDVETVEGERHVLQS